MQIGVESQRAVESKRVFVVDSDDVTGMALQCMLADECETHVFATLDMAIEKRRTWPPDLVILGADVLSGGARAAIDRLVAEGGATRILIVCDALADPRVAEALATGAAGTILRPLKIETVRRRVDAHLGRRAAVGIPVVRS